MSRHGMADILRQATNNNNTTISLGLFPEEDN
jgi:hypothetical protein